ncbi:MAG: hypothetical protein ACRD38_10030, partial [Nitrososphaerales archaeon]
MHSKISTLTIFLTISGLLFAIGNNDSASACECALPVTPVEELERSAAVFSGRVIDISEDQSKNTYEARFEVQFDVERSWKGVFDKTAVVFTALDSNFCGYEFEWGEKYLVYAYASNGSLH